MEDVGVCDLSVRIDMRHVVATSSKLLKRSSLKVLVFLAE